MTNEDLKAQHENLLDEVSHLKKDLELLSSERRQEETHMAELVQKGELLQLANNELRDSLVNKLDYDVHLIMHLLGGVVFICFSLYVLY